jgi:hypothetical protein
MSSRLNPARAYVVVWFRDESSGETKVLNGRETAIYEAAFARVAADRHHVVRKGQLFLLLASPGGLALATALSWPLQPSNSSIGAVEVRTRALSATASLSSSSPKTTA